MTGAWRGRRVLITAGPTREYLDPVRFLTNASSGSMGNALALAARDRGARVCLIRGPIPGTGRLSGVETVPVVTASEMRSEVLARCGKADAVIAAAAVGDWRFDRVRRGKVHRGPKPLRVVLKPNPDIVAEAARRRRRSGRPQALVGFALETSRVMENAREKLLRKGLDMIVANMAESMGSDRIRFAILDRSGGVRKVPLTAKRRAAGIILRHAERFLPPQ